MSNAIAQMIGNTLNVKTGVNKTITPGSRVTDAKTDTTVVFVGKAQDASVRNHPFVFLDVDTNELRRHGAEYIAKYIG